jgi:hypothetical protein
MKVTLQFACGHQAEWQAQDQSPHCPACGERRIAKTLAPVPTFRGVGVSPLQVKE